MITIKREGNIVRVGIETNLPYNEKGVETTFWFDYKASSIQNAELMVRYLEERFKKRVEQIRRIEFFSGWKHAKANKHGKSFFEWFYNNLIDDVSHD